ncbi:TlpA disulfide reductase family protein [Modestobacter sp. DSM 44400]|uniref:TlpA family protein disulfide reductase n=1 Tax=Modestobacter sp. DSM 44400 TaxID=1550230 RepID=UPI001587EA99|nr:TlpA disulfide reductase family protein [Modestobacter sp. DSM 44400]
MAAGLLTTGCGTQTVPDQLAEPPTAASGSPFSAAFLQPCPTAAPGGPHGELPDLKLPCLGSGAPLALDRLPPGSYVINVWASWCVPCREEAPRLRAAAAATSGRVQFLGIDIQDGRDAALSFLADFGIDYPQLQDLKGDTLHRLGSPGVPVTLAVDATGRIAYRRIGEISTDQLAAAVHAANPEVILPSGTGR